MTKNTKSLIKSTILGLLSGGTVGTLYAVSALKDKKEKPEFTDNEIVVPLSKKQYAKVLRNKSPKKEVSEAKFKDLDPSSLSKKDLDSLKRDLLRKRATCDTVARTVSPSSIDLPINYKEDTSSTLRDLKGRFSSIRALDKKAGISEDAKGVILDTAGILGGTAVGIAASKMISDKIILKRKEKEVRRARAKYIASLNAEVNDTDTPYYKSASDRGTIGSTIGVLAATGMLSSLAAGKIVYTIMENRRKQHEKFKDKDLKTYPHEKTINFKLVDDPSEKKAFFA